MAFINDAIQDAVSDVQNELLRALLERKLTEAGIPMPPETIDAYAKHLLSGNDDGFVWDSGDDDWGSKLDLTDEDEPELDAAIDQILGKVPEIFDAGIEGFSRSVFNDLRSKWPDENARQKAETDGFKERLEERWGEGLDYLRMLLTCCREVGREAMARYNKSRSRRHHFRRWVMVRLHTRGCQIADEIICLLENGFAEGAMARWRTLHELSVVALMISEGDEELAERYILHDAIEVKRQADEYDAFQVPAGFKPIAKRERAKIDRRYDDAIARFGPTFAYPYGWAAKKLRLKKPTFKDLQEAVDQSAFSGFYKLASFNVHATARSLFFNLSSIEERETLLAGRSNAGLAEPGERTAQTLLLLTSQYIGDVSKNLDRLAEIKTLLLMRDQVGPALARAAKKLGDDERGHQNERMARAASAALRRAPSAFQRRVTARANMNTGPST